jgi:ABC-type bacteriocin/lantibiotic exporter with double-glycine peptidase domain
VAGVVWERMMLRGLPIVLGMLLSVACTWGEGAKSHAIPPSHVIRGVPFAAYRSDLCGPAALAAVLQFYGEKATAEEIAKEIYLPNYHGTLNLDLLLYARARGFDAWAGEGDAERIREAVAQNRPVICMVRESGRLADRNHFVIIRGYDSARRIWLSDDGDARETPRKMDDFERRWRECSHWMLVVNGKKTPAPPARE